MKTRIISGVVMGVIVAAVLSVGFLWNDVVIVAAIALLAAGAAYEITRKVAVIKSKCAIIGAIVYTFLSTFMMLQNVYSFPFEPMSYTFSAFADLAPVYNRLPILFLLSIAYFLYSVVMVLKNHKDMNLGAIVMLSAMPIFLVGAFSCLGGVINHNEGLYYLLLLFNFSSVCDMGAYFVGVTMGKHKLCPNISPKKTVEGAIGGIVSSVILSLVFVFVFSKTDKLLATLLLTIPFCITGMIGDLFASAIKRSVNLKDYSNLIPGHGGILDRLDSMLLIAPVVYVFILCGVI